MIDVSKLFENKNLQGSYIMVEIINIFFRFLIISLILYGKNINFYFNGLS